MPKLPKQMSATIGTQKKLNKVMGFGSSPKKRKAPAGSKARRRSAK
jgi:hypothetical protein